MDFYFRNEEKEVFHGGEVYGVVPLHFTFGSVWSSRDGRPTTGVEGHGGRVGDDQVERSLLGHPRESQTGESSGRLERSSDVRVRPKRVRYPDTPDTTYRREVVFQDPTRYLRSNPLVRDTFSPT